MLELHGIAEHTESRELLCVCKNEEGVFITKKPVPSIILPEYKDPEVIVSNRKGRKYRHYKGKTYEAYVDVLCEETGETLVLYTDNETNNHWLRPKEMFFGDQVLEDGSVVKRFTPIDNDNWEAW